MSLQRTARIPILVFSSPVYWSDEDILAYKGKLKSALSQQFPRLQEEDWEYHFFSDASKVQDFTQKAPASEIAFFIPMSGGVQPWMIELEQRYKHIVLINAYLPNLFGSEWVNPLLQRNAHPSSACSLACLAGGAPSARSAHTGNRTDRTLGHQ